MAEKPHGIRVQFRGSDEAHSLVDELAAAANLPPASFLMGISFLDLLREFPDWPDISLNFFCGELEDEDV